MILIRCFLNIAGNSVDQFSGWLASEGIIDIQSLLRSGNADISGTSDSGFGTGMDVDDLVSTSDSEGESSETNVPVPIEVQQVMALPPVRNQNSRCLHK